ncbi:MAG: hypothetical protein ABDH21_03095 [bacterium]
MGNSSIESLYVDNNNLFAVGMYKNTSTNHDDMYVAKLDLSSNNWTHNHFSLVITGDKDITPTSIYFANNTIYIAGHFVRSNNQKDGFLLKLNPSNLQVQSTPYLIDLSNNNNDPQSHTEVYDFVVDGTSIFLTGSAYNNTSWIPFVYKIQE